jgi:hypothetical protein
MESLVDEYFNSDTAQKLVVLQQDLSRLLKKKHNILEAAFLH